MYDPQTVLNAIDQHTLPILAAGALLFIGAFIQYGEGIRQGFAHKSYAIPLAPNLYFFAHDTVYIALYDRWFNQIDHWFFELFWIGIAPFLILEFVLLYQMAKYARNDLMPGFSLFQFLGTYALMQVGVFFVFWFIFSLMDDRLFLVSFTTTIVMSNLFNTPMTIRRGSRRGQSILLDVGLIMQAIGLFAMLAQMDPFFRTPTYLGLGICTISLAAANLIVLSKYPPYEPATA